MMFERYLYGATTVIVHDVLSLIIKLGVIAPWTANRVMGNREEHPRERGEVDSRWWSARTSQSQFSQAFDHPSITGPKPWA